MRKQPPFGGRVRAALLLMLVGIALLFVIAWTIRPYDEAGNARRQETHVQLGLPPCSFRAMTGKPCPSCGMTTSVALASRGDVGNSLRANWAGTLLAVFLAALIPWAVLCLMRKRLVWFGTLEQLVTVSILFFLGLAVFRWGLLIGIPWLGR